MVARKNPHLAITTCAFTADGKIDLNVVVVSNSDTNKDAVVLRDALQEETRKSSCRATPWGFQHCYGKKAAK